MHWQLLQAPFPEATESRETRLSNDEHALRYAYTCKNTKVSYSTNYVPTVFNWSRIEALIIYSGRWLLESAWGGRTLFLRGCDFVHETICFAMGATNFSSPDSRV